MSNCLKFRTFDLEISGVGKNKNEALNSAFQGLKRIASNKIGDEILIGMKPIKVEVISTDIEEKTERFLFLFMPRKKQKIKITLLVTVETQSLTV